MIANANELEVALQNLRSVERAHDILRVEMTDTNPAFFPAVSQTYTRRMSALREDIFAYLRENPAEAPLKVRLAGAAISAGEIGIGIIARLLQAMQRALFQEGKAIHDSIASALTPGNVAFRSTSLKTLLGLNMVATQTGSFILALDLAPRQLNLFDEFDLAERALTQMLTHICELTEPRTEFSGDKLVLRSLDKIASLIVADKLSTIEFSYKGEKIRQEAAFNIEVKEHIGTLLGRPRRGEETVSGQLISIDIERNTCRIRPDGESVVRCDYSDDTEDDLIVAVKKRIEVSGEILPLSKGSEHRRIKRIDRMRVLGYDDDEI